MVYRASEIARTSRAISGVPWLERARDEVVSVQHHRFPRRVPDARAAASDKSREGKTGRTGRTVDSRLIVAPRRPTNRAEESR
jgi:hypothetical protein